ncbi:MAG: hypothetical protein KKC14_09380 [Alphaproteobacteria bacterium]|nr:hypothetical protein [Alphaproteobacteria bacterium]
MVAHDAPYGAPPAAPKPSGAPGRLSQMFGRKAEVAEPVAPAPDYVLTPDADGKITLAGYKIPVALALLGAGVVAALLIHPRTRGPVLATAATAWGAVGKTFA